MSSVLWGPVPSRAARSFLAMVFQDTPKWVRFNSHSRVDTAATLQSGQLIRGWVGWEERSGDLQEVLSKELDFPSTARGGFSILREADGVPSLGYCLLFRRGPRQGR